MTRNYLMLRSAKALAAAFLLSATMVACNNESSPNTGEDTSANGADTTPKSDATHQPQHMDTAAVPMVDAAVATISGTYPDTAVNGEAKFTVRNGKVKMVLNITVEAKANKSVAVHLHEHGDCGDNGKNSHGHWNPTKEDHGKWGTSPFHRGDIGNVKLDGKGKGTLTVETDLWTLGGAHDKNILGKALIVHGGVDDYKTQPTGNAGSRLGCGVIQ